MSFRVRPEWRQALAAVLLAVLGFVLNRISLPLLTEETPPFVFGGIAVLAAFVWLGPRWGLLVGVAALGESFARVDTVGLGTLVYIAEAWLVASQFSRTGSLVLNVVAFWLVVGWLWDYLVFGLVVGVNRDYILLLYLRQVLGGALNAVIVDSLALALATTRWRAPNAHDRPTTLYDVARRRVLVAVAGLVVVLGIVLARAIFREALNADALAQQRSATIVNAALRGFLEDRSLALGRLASDLALVHERGEAWTAAPVDTFHASHREFLNVGVVRDDGLVLLMSPATGVSGQRLTGHSIAERAYFREAREHGRAVFAPLILGTLHVRDPKNPEPIVVIAHPIAGAGGRFLGLVLGAVPSALMRDILQANRHRPAEVTTLVDGDGQVIATIDPRLAVGMRIGEILPAGITTAPEAWTGFRYYPPADGSLESRLHMNLDHAVFQQVPPSPWGILVSVPATRLHAAMAPFVGWGMAALVLALAIGHFVSVSLARSLSAPLVAVSHAAHALANREFDLPPALANENIESIDELVRLRTDMSTLAASLRHYRALTDEQQAALEERFRAIFTQAAVGIAIVSADGRYEMVNDRFCEMLDRGRDDVIGVPADAFVSDDEAAAFRARLDEIGAGGVVAPTSERRLALPTGAVRWVTETVSAVRNADGRARYFIVVAEDLTERKQLEATMLHGQRLESIGRLAGGIAHDFNNLMTAVLGYSDLVRDSLTPDDRRRSDVAEIRRAAERAAALTARLLAFARRQVVEPRVIDLNDVVLRVEAMLRRLIGEDVEFTIALTPEAWPVKADVSQIEQVVMNLVVNARDAIEPGGRITIQTVNAPGVAIRGDCVDDAVDLIVSDTGTGLSDEARAHLFEPFFTTKERDKGTGLGLATCFGIVTQAGGSILVDSAPGKGASFTVRLPRARQAPKADSPPPPAQPAPAHGTILLVEDEPAVAALAATTLARVGYVLLQARDGVEALELAAAHPGEIDLVLTDIVMPRMGGVALAAAIRQVRPQSRLLFMSGYAADAFESGQPLPADIPLMVKPFTVASLCDAVRQALDRPAQVPAASR